MTWLWRAFPKSFSASSDRTAHAAGTIFEPGSRPREELVQVGRDQPWQEQEQASELGAEVARRQVEPPDVRHVGHDGTGRSGRSSSPRRGSFAKPSPRDQATARAERFAFASEGAADVVDGRGSASAADDLIPQALLLAWRTGFARGGRKKSRPRWSRKRWTRTRKLPACNRIAWPLRRTGRPRRRRPAAPRIGGGWSWTAPRRGEPVLGDLWNYRPWCQVSS